MAGTGMAMRRKASVPVLAALLLSGCTMFWRSDSNNFDQGNVPDMVFARDDAACQNQGEAAEAGRDVNDYLLVYNRAYEACMRRNGYRKDDMILGLY